MPYFIVKRKKVNDVSEVRRKIQLDREEEEGNEMTEKLLEKGLHISDCIESFDETFGFLIFSECEASFIFQILCYYELSTVADFFDPGLETTTNKRFLVAASAVALVASVFRIWNLANRAQDIIDEMGKMRSALQRVKMSRRFQSTDETTKCKLDILIEKMSDCSPIRPYKGFVLNRAMLVSGFGLIVTYTIVLWQFKFSEGNSSPSSCPCSTSPANATATTTLL